MDKQEILELVDIEISCLELASGNYENEQELKDELYRISNVARTMVNKKKETFQCNHYT